MIHLQAVSHQDVPSFGEGSECVYICLCVCVCVCVCHCNTSVLSRWYIFKQFLVKMFHLLAREVNVCTYKCLCLCVCHSNRPINYRTVRTLYYMLLFIKSS